MAKLKIVKFGDDTLRKVCRPVDEITPRIKMLLDDMIDTMRAAEGCGLAAPQVGVLRRIAVIEVETELLCCFHLEVVEGLLGLRCKIRVSVAVLGHDFLLYSQKLFCNLITHIV